MHNYSGATGKTQTRFILVVGPTDVGTMTAADFAALKENWTAAVRNDIPLSLGHIPDLIPFKKEKRGRYWESPKFQFKGKCL